VIFYSPELDELILFLGRNYDGEQFNFAFANAPWIDGLIVESDFDWVIVGYL
jgi:hypothetical protein